MTFLQTPDLSFPTPKQSNPLRRDVYCIHCFQRLDTDSTAIPRAALLAKHKCAESQIAKQPAAPPPYN